MILAAGVFDGLHIGHVRYLQRAAALLAHGEMFRVAIAPDAYVRQVKQREPRWGERERAAVVFALGMVDATVIHDAQSVASIIRDYQPRLFVKGADWHGRIQTDVQAACQAVGCEIQIIDSGITQHTSDALSARR